MNDPLVTVLIPTKDRPELLGRALRSVVTQTYPNLEILVVDDGSSPAVQIPKSLQNEDRIRTLRLDRCQGPATARNLGLQNARGAFIAFLDDDDELEPQRIENGVVALRNTPGHIAAVESGHTGWFEDEQVYDYVPPVKRDLRASLLREPTIALPTIMVKRSALEAVGMFDPAMDRYEDWDLWLRLTDKYDVVALRELHVRRRLHHPVPARVRLHHYSKMIRRIAPRIRSRPIHQQIALWAWHARFFVYRMIEILIEVVARDRFVQELKIRRLRRSGFTNK